MLTFFSQFFHESWRMQGMGHMESQIFLTVVFLSLCVLTPLAIALIVRMERQERQRALTVRLMTMRHQLDFLREHAC